MNRRQWTELEARLNRMETILRSVERSFLKKGAELLEAQAAEEAGPEAGQWLQEGLNGILGYQPGRKKGEE